MGMTSTPSKAEQDPRLGVLPDLSIITKREKRACRRCQQGGVASAPVPARIVDKGLVSDRVVIDTIVGKYCDHLPLYRQSAILERETGVEICRATLILGWSATYVVFGRTWTTRSSFTFVDRGGEMLS